MLFIMFSTMKEKKVTNSLKHTCTHTHIHKYVHYLQCEGYKDGEGQGLACLPQGKEALSSPEGNKSWELGRLHGYIS